MENLLKSAAWLVALWLTSLLSFGQAQPRKREWPSVKVGQQADNSYVVATGQRISPVRSNFTYLSAMGSTAAAQGAAVPLPTSPRQQSTFRHVVYIIKENRTYDELLGDMTKGNGDASLCMFCGDVTQIIMPWPISSFSLTISTSMASSALMAISGRTKASRPTM